MCTLRIPVAIALLLVVGAGAQAQEVTFRLDASIPCCSAGEHVFGWLDSSNAGIDPADVPEPPSPPVPHLAAAFRIPGLPEPNRWRRDLRATGDFTGDRRETWELVLSTNSGPATCTLTIAPGDGDPAGLRLIFAGAYQDTLAIPATISFPLADEAQLFIEVVAENVPNDAMNWGAVKLWYE